MRSDATLNQRMLKVCSSESVFGVNSKRHQLIKSKNIVLSRTLLNGLVGLHIEDNSKLF